MKKTCVICDVCGNVVTNGRVMWTQTIVDGRGRHGNSRMDICERCFSAFKEMFRQKDSSLCAEGMTIRSV